MKKFVMGFLSMVLVLVSIWGINAKGRSPKTKAQTDTTLWI